MPRPEKRLHASPGDPPTRSPRSTAGFSRGVLAIAGLSSLALAQPIYDLLRRTPEFFAIRQLSALDLLALVSLLAIGPTLVLSTAAAAARLLRPVWVEPAVAAPIGLLAGTIVLQAVRDLSAAVAIGMAAAACVAVAWAYLRFAGLRFIASFLSAAVVLAPGILILDDDVRRSLFDSKAGVAMDGPGAKAPVVVLVFDEWSVTSILDSDGGIDRRRFPNLARFADRATWYPNATAASNMTNHAVPAILTGMVPERGRLPTVGDHPTNLFTLLAPSHEIFAQEPVTSLCPPNLNQLEGSRPPFARRFGLLVSDLRFVWLKLTSPEAWADRLPSLAHTWSGFDRYRSQAGQSPPTERELARAQPHRRNDERVADFRRFIESIGSAGARPALHFAHVLLPHAPWEYLPSGRRYSRSRPYGLRDGIWTTDPWTVTQHRKRYLMQVEFMDRLIGEALDKLESLDLFDRSLVVITADHGLSFRPGGSMRLPDQDRSGDQVLDLLAVPLIVKAPFQDRPEIDDLPFSLVDLMPRILNLAGAPPVADHTRTGPGSLLFGDHASGLEVPTDRGPWRRRRIAEQTGLLGESNDPTAIGVVPELHGRPVSEFPLRAGKTSARLDLPHAWDDVDLEARTLPAVVEASLYGPEEPNGRPVVVALNGIVAESGRPYVDSRGQSRVSAILPDGMLRPGRNQIELFLVSDREGVLELERLSPPTVFAYRVSTDYRYEPLRNDAGLIVGLGRNSTRDSDRPTESLRVVPGSRELVGYLNATVPVDPQEAEARPLFRVSGRAFDAESSGKSGTIVIVIGGREATAFTGPALRNNGFTLEVRADRELVEREGIVAFAVGQQNVATRLRFSYQALERGADGTEIVPTSDGRRLTVAPPGGGFGGAVEAVTAVDKGTIVRGWVADRERRESARQVVIYRDGEFLTVLRRVNRDRTDIAEKLGDPRLLRTGFRGPAPGGPLPSVFARRHQVFGIMASGVAVELPIVPAPENDPG